MTQDMRAQCLDPLSSFILPIPNVYFSICVLFIGSCSELYVLMIPVQVKKGKADWKISNLPLCIFVRKFSFLFGAVSPRSRFGPFPLYSTSSQLASSYWYTFSLFNEQPSRELFRIRLLAAQSSETEQSFSCLPLCSKH